MIKRADLTFPILKSLKAKVSHIFVLFCTISLFLILYNPFNLMDGASSGLASIIYSSVMVGLIFSVIATITLIAYKKKLNENRFMLYDYILMIIINISGSSILFSLGSTSIIDYLESYLLVSKITLMPYLLTTSLSFITHLIKELIEKKALLASAKAEQGAIEMINFNDEYGNTSFYLDKNSILYVEANDNYVNIYYYASLKVSYKILRASMKSVETLLAPYSIIRCHRSYMVHTEKINSIHKHKGKLKLTLSEGDYSIPVSTTFAPAIERILLNSPLKQP